MANLPGGSGSFYNQTLGGAGATTGFYSSATQPIASATPTSGGANPTTGAYYSQLQTPPATPTTPTTPDWTTSPNTGEQPGTAAAASAAENNPGTIAPIVVGNGTFGGLGTNAPTPGVPDNTGLSPTSAATTTPTSTAPGSTPDSAPTPGVLSGPGYGESWYQQNGNNLSGPSNSQSLYDEGVSATNPYYQHAMDVTNQSIDLAEAARGEGNSGAALAEIGNADATLSGQQALAQENLAGQADTSNTSQFTAGSNAANNAETQTNNRVNGAASAYTNLSNDQANMVDNFFQMAESGQLQANMAGIEAQLAASGVDAATQQAIINDLSSLGGAAIKAGSM